MRLVLFLISTLFLSFFSNAQFVLAAETGTVSAANAKIYSQPSDSSKEVGSLTQGKKLNFAGAEKQGFLPIKTKSGRSLWIKKADVQVAESPVENDLASEEEDHSPKKFSYDLGFATGSYNNKTYSEANLGLNYHWLPFLIWRNALFARFIDPQNAYGLDTSLRAQAALNFGVAGVLAFAGPGYRFVNQGLNAPFVEGGAVLKLLGFNIGLGIKKVMNSMTDKNQTDDTQYFLILSGAGSF